MDEVDVVIIGAGPVGGYAARLLREHNVAVHLIEEHSEIGRPFQCAGLVNPSAIERIGDYSSVLQEIDGALIHGPDGTVVPVGTEGEIRTYSVCRKKFDMLVVQQAIELGATISMNTKAIDADITDDGVRLEINQNGEMKQIHCKLLIGADGAHSWTRRKFKMGYPKETMIGFQTEVTGYQSKARWLEMYSGREVAPGFFAWVIPTGFDTHRIGVWSTAKHMQDDKSIESYYNTLLSHPLWSEKFKHVKEISRYCGPIPAGMVRYPVKDRVMLLGDAAGMAKPTTGGGIGPGFEQISLIVETLSGLIQENKLGIDNLKKLVAKPWSKMKKEQDRARKLRNILVSDCDDKTLNKHFNAFADPKTIELINKVGDIEKPVPLGIALLKNVPAFRPLALKTGVKLVLGS
ncbi:MAG: NAD(P)/FAD-dependent oxidoreductase [archaeon]|nr:NAD(P)/FAD-dependent oxidoreductase [archaeon]MDA1168456.1 NAD(P)/FAD-dependent oxidoreductase [archaeon]